MTHKNGSSQPQPHYRTAQRPELTQITVGARTLRLTPIVDLNQRRLCVEGFS